MPHDDAAVRWRKWDGTQHWTSDIVLLGEDEYGVWLGRQVGGLQSRPGASYIATTDSAVLVPHVGDWVATFIPDGHPDRVRIYVDIAADVRWDRESRTLMAIDMDLDVIRTDDERGVWIDDEDEFDEHRVAMGYPDDVAAATAEEVRRLVLAGHAPFDGRAEA
ncbi:MAG: DUF402 domain-containing protein, partial [Lacisediminihabitans sp.]